MGAGHFIGSPYLPTVANAFPVANSRMHAFGADRLYVGGSPKAYAAADADSRPRVIAFLKSSRT